MQNKKQSKKQGVKYDGGKPRISLLPGLAIEQVMLVAEFGAKKYGDDNYRLGMPVTRFINAAYRHIFKEWLFKGIDIDPESGYHHLAHGAWNILAALEQMIVLPEFDNRWTKRKNDDQKVGKRRKNSRPTSKRKSRAKAKVKTTNQLNKKTK